MIKLYYRKGCGSSRKAISWFEHYNIEVQHINVAQLTSDDLLEILPLTTNGFEEVMKNKRCAQPEIEFRHHEILDLSFTAGVEYLAKHSILIRTPIILGENKISVGYQVDEIRGFFPKIYREQSRLFEWS